MRKASILFTIISLFIIQACQVYEGVEKRSNDDSAISIAKKIRGAQLEFEKRHGKGKYGTLHELLKETLIPSDLADGIEQGYKFSIKVTDNKYAFQAIPIDYGTEHSQGNFSLYLDESGVIKSATKKGIDLPVWEVAGPESAPTQEQ